MFVIITIKIKSWNVFPNTNIVHFYCRFGKHYELPLLLQSILMILAMFIMIKLCINVQNRTQIIKTKERVLTGEYNVSYYCRYTNTDILEFIDGTIFMLCRFRC